MGGCTSGWGGCRAEVWVEDLWPKRLHRGEEFLVDSFNGQAKEDWLFPRTGHPWKLGAREYKGWRGALAVPRTGRMADPQGQPPPPAQSTVGTSSTELKLQGSPDLGLAAPSNALDLLELVSVQSECSKILKSSDYFLYPRAQLL